MINPKELRIDNLVFSITLEIVCPVQTIEVSSIALKCDTGRVRCDYVDHKYASINPIPLIPEWLKRLGFVKGVDHMSGHYVFVNGCSVFPSPSDEMLYEYCDRGHPLKAIKYVHQLQNLYFALTSQELTIKEKV